MADIFDESVLFHPWIGIWEISNRTGISSILHHLVWQFVLLGISILGVEFMFICPWLPRAPIQINKLLDTFLCVFAERGTRQSSIHMSLTYKILKIQESERAINCDGTHLKELLLTDLNSEGRFQIRVLIIGPDVRPITGVVFEGPENWVERVVALHHDNEKILSQWKEGDRLIDTNPNNK